jgi:tRNA dimethylallyltransferase
MATSPSRPELLVIVGPTASGKSDLALRIAKEFNGEIIAADSWTVYRGFDIGTSKPTITQQKAVKHHLIDVRQANQGFNAPLFKAMALKSIQDIQKRGKLPIMVGGTGLYIDSVIYDYGFLDNSSPEERRRLNAMELKDLLELAGRRRVDLDDIDIRNKRRVIRAIEARGAKPTKAGLRPGTLIVGLKVGNDELRKRVELRTEKMLEAGLEQEVKTLADKYGWEAEPMKGIGYREWREYFDGSRTLGETKARIISATMGLAKRQRTWFKRSPDIQWFGSIDQAAGYLSRLLNT